MVFLLRYIGFYGLMPRFIVINRFAYFTASHQRRLRDFTGFSAEHSHFIAFAEYIADTDNNLTASS